MQSYIEWMFQGKGRREEGKVKSKERGKEGPVDMDTQCTRCYDEHCFYSE